MNIFKSPGIKYFIIVSFAFLYFATQFKNTCTDESGYKSVTIYPVPDSQFIIGAFENAKDINYDYQGEMRFNTWHKYTGPYNFGWPGVANDMFDKDIDSYSQEAVLKIDFNERKGMRTLMDRPIIEYLVSGQRIDYQCEYIKPSFSADRYWFYAYDSSLNNSTTVFDVTDDSRYGNGEKVKRCKSTEQTISKGFVTIDSGIRANRELTFTQTNQWMRDNAYEWYVMPRIRIDSAFAADGNNDNIPVCKIELHGWNGASAKEIILTVKNFKDSISNKYNGSYKETYQYLPEKRKLEISTSEINTYFIHPGGNTFWWEGELNKTDIKVLWSGKCDMWIDRVRIENQPAHRYLTLKEKLLYNKVDDEVQLASRNYNASNPRPNNFYFEECQMSHFPMIKELNKQITSSSENRNELIVWLNYDLFKIHIPQDWKYKPDADLMKQYIYDDYGLRTIVMGSYALEGWAENELLNDPQRQSFHPNTLTDSKYNVKNGILSRPLSPNNYDKWLQEHFDGDVYPWGVNYSWISQLMYELSKKGMRIINSPQTHIWMQSAHKLKEPSNEELELEANLALTNNSKGIIWFAYVGDDKVFGSDEYNVCLMNYGNPPTKRESNVYGQNKYLKICQINSYLEKRGPYIMSFSSELTKNCIYRLKDERSKFLSNTYFSDIVTYRYSNGPLFCPEENPGGTNPQGLAYECNSDRYLQAAIFKTSAEDVNKYFMVVNRRCSPFLDNSTEERQGGKRFIRISLDKDSPEFTCHDKWEIINLDTDKSIAVFDKGESKLLDLGWYNPGQGVLYKIRPVK
jgi:hypothetical protein